MTWPFHARARWPFSRSASSHSPAVRSSTGGRDHRATIRLLRRPGPTRRRSRRRGRGHGRSRTAGRRIRRHAIPRPRRRGRLETSRENRRPLPRTRRVLKPHTFPRQGTLGPGSSSTARALRAGCLCSVRSPRSSITRRFGLLQATADVQSDTRTPAAIRVGQLSAPVREYSPVVVWWRGDVAAWWFRRMSKLKCLKNDKNSKTKQGPIRDLSTFGFRARPPRRRPDRS